MIDPKRRMVAGEAVDEAAKVIITSIPVAS